MPAWFLVPIAGAAGSMAVGWALDHAIGDGKYSAEEAVLDAALGATGAGVVKPLTKIGSAFNRSRRVVAGKPASSIEGLAMRSAGVRFPAKPVPIVSGRTNQLAFASYRTAVMTKGSQKRLARFAVISGGHSYLTRGGSGSPSLAVTNEPIIAPITITSGDRRPMRPSGRPSTPKASTRAKRARRKFRRKCPPGHYWSWKKRKCVKSKY